ncbi:MAG: Bifunctional protein FolD [Chloroflexi bacterium]|jgi:methylenetetrahydrofolate dehydrogenase (NADP+)/methenyltetrahydrofolate cyclohydrolase|nr:Bifunctional protein FolD [Chloroflexota bacterium]
MDTAKILEGRSLAKEKRAQLKADAAEFAAQTGYAPGLAVNLIGEDPSSIAYTRTLIKSATDLGFNGSSRVLPISVSLDEFKQSLTELNNDPKVHGITVQWPTPPQITFEDVVSILDPRKDVDGYNPLLLGRLYEQMETFVPATPLGGIQLLKHYGYNVRGKSCLLIGHGVTVGRPLLALLLAEHASLMIVDKSTPKDLFKLYAGQADFIFCAAGAPGILTGDMVKPGVVVIDFGTSQVGERLVGDADFESLLPVAGAITPTPGGTGPMTNVTLLENVLKAARQQAGL